MIHKYSAPLSPAYYSAVFSKFSDTLVKGMKTNFGIFSHWDGYTAIFEGGWVAYKSLHFIQIRNEESDRKSQEAIDRMLRANGIPVA